DALAGHLIRVSASCVAAPLFPAVGPLFWFTLSHHWFASLFLVLATLAALRAPLACAPRWLFVGGLCCALAGLSHQPRGALGALALIACLGLWPRERGRGLVAAIAGVALGALPPLLVLGIAVGPLQLGYDLLGVIL